MLSDFHAYKTMFHFLDGIWSSRKTEFDFDFPGLLSNLSPTLFGHENPAFPGEWDYWKRCATSESLTNEEAFEAMLEYLRIYQVTESERKEISKVISLIEESKDESLRKWITIAHDISSSN